MEHFPSFNFSAFFFFQDSAQITFAFIIVGFIFLVGGFLVRSGIKAKIEKRDKLRAKAEQKRQLIELLDQMTPDEQFKHLEELKIQKKFGAVKPQMICPHCQTKGTVRTKNLEQKRGISGGKATVALLTSGISLLATGLSRKEEVTKAHCENCLNTWLF